MIESGAHDTIGSVPNLLNVLILILDDEGRSYESVNRFLLTCTLELGHAFGDLGLDGLLDGVFVLLLHFLLLSLLCAAALLIRLLHY